MGEKWDHSSSNVSVRTAADTCGLGVDQGLECGDMTGSTTRLLLMLTTPSECLRSHVISNDWSWSESLGAKALKNGPLWPFLWVLELSGRKQLHQLFALYNFWFYFCCIVIFVQRFLRPQPLHKSCLILSFHDLSNPLKGPGLEEPPASVLLPFFNFSAMQEASSLNKHVLFTHAFINVATCHQILLHL